MKNACCVHEGGTSPAGLVLRLLRFPSVTLAFGDEHRVIHHRHSLPHELDFCGDVDAQMCVVFVWTDTVDTIWFRIRYALGLIQVHGC